MLEIRNIFKNILKKKSQTDIKLDEFDAEAIEGWNSLPNAEENFDSILNALDKKIDALAGISEKGNTFQIEKKTKPGSIGKWIALAASILLIVGVSVYIFQSNETQEQQLFSTYFSPRVHPDAPVRGESVINLNEVEAKAMYAYEAEDFKKAINHYEILVREYPRNSKHALFLSISYLGVNNPEKAINVLSRLEKVDENYKSDIAWYLALAYLKNNEKNAARIVLESLVKEDSFYTESAIEILNALGK